MGYTEDRAFSDETIDLVKRVIAEHCYDSLLIEAPDDLDMTEATDLMFFEARDVRIGARVRRPGYASAYPRQFTIRTRRPSGVSTEWEKIAKGHADYYLYAHLAESRDRLALWHFLDMDEFRYAAMTHAAGKDQISYHSNLKNEDGTGFTAYEIDSFPNRDDLVVASNYSDWKRDATDSDPAKVDSPY